ncbi:FadR/GntR family transcriptional regulator [Paraburkholderia tropica]|uniref:FadR/GntR family transcriptional regulator n=3 Tax=Paraburkholderia tropica TaxID=92647 RepID=UPI002AB1AEFC|nr:FCD domain-containing protein [Paraburkholderia tropica]
MERTIDDDVLRLREYVEKASVSDNPRLPPEPKLGEMLGVSRGRLRTLLKRLEDEGLIWRHVGKGTFAGPRQTSVDDEALAAMISVDHIMDARLLLEPQLAAQAAIHATPADLAAMDQCLDEMSSAASFLQWKRLDDKLHRLIAAATHNAVLLILYDALRSQVKLTLDVRFEEVYGDAAGPLEATGDEHRSFIDAIRKHNPVRAQQAMRAHLNSVRDSLFGLQ